MVILRLFHQQRLTWASARAVSSLKLSCPLVNPATAVGSLSSSRHYHYLHCDNRRRLKWNHPHMNAGESRRHKFTQTPATGADDGKTGTGPSAIRDALDLSFNDARQAYRSKSTWEILRGYIVFKLCAVETLVENNQKLMRLSQKILGKRLFEKVMKGTFYGHFVAGEDQISIQPNIQRLREFGVKAILDYSVEEDISEDEAEKVEQASCTPLAGNQRADNELKKYHFNQEFADRRRKAVQRTYFYMNEAQCEKNMSIFLQSIEAVSGATKGTGFAAIKITALGRPQLLLHLSEAIARVHRYVGAVTGKKGLLMEQGAKPEDLARRLERAAKLDPTVQSWLDNMTYDSSGLIHILPWKGLVEAQKGLGDTLKVPDLSTGKLQNLLPPLVQEEEEMFKNMMRRLHTVFKVATKLDVRVMVDAEQTYFQPAISRLTMEMMRKYNTEKAIVFNTYQCYLKKAFRELYSDLEEAERQNFYFGAKLVRGAYMEQERQRAAVIGYKDPINPDFEATTEMYHRCIEEGMLRIKRLKKTGQHTRINLMAATHNEDAVRFVIKKMKEHGIKRSDRCICFGQLYGMCDQITFPLGQSGYSVYKYVPYGPVCEVLPYLSRRAHENRGMIGKTEKEVKLLRKEFFRRVLKGQLFYRPKGYYQVT